MIITIVAKSSKMNRNIKLNMLLKQKINHEKIVFVVTGYFCYVSLHFLKHFVLQMWKVKGEQVFIFLLSFQKNEILGSVVVTAVVSK